MAFSGVALLSGQTSKIPTDVKAFSILDEGKVFLVGSDGTISVVGKDSNVIATLPPGGVEGLTFYTSPSPLVDGGFAASTANIGQDGTIYFNTYCVQSSNGASFICAIYSWDMKSQPKKILSKGDRVLTDSGYITITTLDRTIGVDGNDVLFTTNATKLIRRKNGTAGPTYSTEYSGGFTTVGPHVAATAGSVYLSKYSAASISSLNGELLRLGRLGGPSSLLPTLGSCYWRPTVDPVSKEVYAVADCSILTKYRESKAFRVNHEPTLEILATKEAGPMTVNGQKVYLGLDSPWNGRSFAPIFDFLSVYSETTKSWGKVLQVGDTVEGKKITGIKLAIPFPKHVLVLTNEGWVTFDPTKELGEPIFTAATYEPEDVTLKGTFPGIGNGKFFLTVHQNGSEKGENIYPTYSPLFKEISESKIVFKLPSGFGGTLEFKIQIQRNDNSLGPTKSITLNLPPERTFFKVEAPKQVGMLERAPIVWSSNTLGRLTAFGCSPRGNAILPAVDTLGGEVVIRPSLKTTCTLEFTPTKGDKVFAEVTVDVDRPAIAATSAELGPVYPGSTLTVWGANFGVNTDDFHFVFEWNDTKVVRVSPSDAEMVVPDYFAPGALTLFAVRSDGSQSEPVTVNIQQRPEKEE